VFTGCDIINEALDYTTGKWKDAPQKPNIPPTTFLLRWYVAGERQEMTWEKVEAEGRIYSENVGWLFPAGADGDCLSIFYTDPYIEYPPVLQRAWYDTINVIDGENEWVEVWTYEITSVDTTIVLDTMRYDNCYQISGSNDITREYTLNYFAPDIGMVAFFTSYSQVEGYLIEYSILGNETKDGYTFQRDCLPTMIGNEWTYLMPGTSFDYINSYKIVE
jgi:hypothetical protein